MDDLVQFLRDRLDEDEAVARACAGDGGWDASNIAIYGPDLAPEVREHMARHDPARVLAEVEAKRQIIELCEPPLVDVTGYGPVESRDYIPGEGEAWGLPVLKRLALPYANHPDYREEWRP
ncbi:DUF6221 family protein [Streptomyces rimosus]|uniref:DUF6221 family protein n=1 Tax=Streptomyces rimosus TaxID=1927 RepID=UPI0004CB1F6D|nr:DUF6221 family protein [Streptomyces rimosus]